EHQVGRTSFAKIEVDAATIESQPALVTLLAARADPDLVLDARLVGVRPDELDLHLDEIETALAPSFLKVRVRAASLPALTQGPPRARPPRPSPRARPRRRTRSPGPSSATSRRASRSWRRLAPRTRQPSIAT